jgi:hypothetical protein
MKGSDAVAVPSAAQFEKLGVFYLGRPYDPAARQVEEGVLLYDAKDLVTHAVCVGMTGSGKTGLCLALLEEAAIDGVPAIVIDPKGDLPNLLLTFPDLRPEDFRPWINEDDASRKGMSPDDYAREQAATWQQGLAASGQDGARIRRLRAAVDMAVYTPGSTAGLPVSILRSFAAPPPGLREDAELLRERIGTTATSLLGLLGIDADPVRSREHILIATVLDQAWRQGQDLDLSALIQRIQSPPVSRVGVLDLESFFPAKDRFDLATALNNLLAAPGFAAWMEGEPLEVQRMLYTERGQPRVSIFSIAHLGDAERMFFVSLLLNQTVAWMRNQPGTTSLRALVYMDEIFGYLPPVANPPSKLPLLTLLKQARAYGVGLVVATQNPVDLDYKALANAGTWFIGRLQTERDKARLMEGLQGAAAGAAFDRARIEQTLAGLRNRVFLMNNVHEDRPVLLETRWVMSYLRGPLTRSQIKTLMDPRRASAAIRDAAASAAAPAVAGAAAARAGGELAPRPGGPGTADRPVLPPDIPQHFAPVRGGRPNGAALVYRPMLLGAARIHLADAKAGVDATREIAVVASIPDGASSGAWEQAEDAPFAVDDLEAQPQSGAAFAELPAPGGRKKSYDAWAKALATWLQQTQALELFRSPGLKLVSRPGESEADFRARLQLAAREARDGAVEQLREKYAGKIAALEERIRRAEQAVERESEQAKEQGWQAAISAGATVLGAFLGRKAVSSTSIGRATTAMRGASRAMKERKDVDRARDTVAALREQREQLDAAFRAEAENLAGRLEPLTERLEPVKIRPKRQGVSVKLVGLAWMPCWRGADGTLHPAWR